MIQFIRYRWVANSGSHAEIRVGAAGVESAVGRVAGPASGGLWGPHLHVATPNNPQSESRKPDLPLIMVGHIVVWPVAPALCAAVIGVRRRPRAAAQGGPHHHAHVARSAVMRSDDLITAAGQFGGRSRAHGASPAWRRRRTAGGSGQRPQTAWSAGVPGPRSVKTTSALLPLPRSSRCRVAGEFVSSGGRVGQVRPRSTGGRSRPTVRVTVDGATTKPASLMPSLTKAREAIEHSAVPQRRHSQARLARQEATHGCSLLWPPRAPHDLLA